ncbi:MAG: hypothetical protein LBI16_01810, partial [Burkholderiales bacterium]|nr:hypothetical protein [Burkholderiales bacterium]
LGAAASQSNDDHNRYASKGCAKKGSNYIPDSIRSFDLTRRIWWRGHSSAEMQAQRHCGRSEAIQKRGASKQHWIALPLRSSQ